MQSAKIYIQYSVAKHAVCNYYLTVFISFYQPSGLVLFNNKKVVPRAQKREDQRAAGFPAALTQLTLCLRLALI